MALVRSDVSEEHITSIIRAFLHSMLWLLVTANVVPSSLILVILMMEVLHSYKTSILTRATGHNNPEDGILINFKLLHRLEYTISDNCYIFLPY
jgi:hypothetical protein